MDFWLCMSFLRLIRHFSSSESYGDNTDSILKTEVCQAQQGPSSQGYWFSSGLHMGVRIGL